MPFRTLCLPSVSEAILCYYVTHCARNLHLCYSTIKSHLSAIRHHYTINSAPNPLRTSTGQPLLALELTMRGIRKANNQPCLKRFPITLDILYGICHKLHHGMFGSYMDALLLAACTTAFFGFLRCGEFTTLTKTFDRNQHLGLRDITLIPTAAPRTAHVHIKVSKTDPFRQGFTLQLFRLNSCLCPVSALESYLRLRLNSPLQSPAFFLLPEGAPLSRNRFIECLRFILQQLGYSPYGYNGHSFRIGAATSAARAGIPDHMIKTLGRWTSDCYQRYIRIAPSHLASAHRTLGSCSPHGCRATAS